MDQKELKSTLKSAREAIRNKEYKEALKHCKSILKHDKNNYNALVFVGVAAEGLEQPDQAVMAYKKATESAPEQLLAWQGLAGFYEKAGHAENNEELCIVFEKLRELLQNDAGKCFEVTDKLYSLYVSMDKIDEALGAMKACLNLVTEESKKFELWKKITDVLEEIKELTTEQEDMLAQGYRQIIHHKPDPDTAGQTIGRYIELLKKTELLAGRDPLPEIVSLSEKFPDIVSHLEVLCQAYTDKTASGAWTHGIDIHVISNRLRQLDPDNVYVRWLDALQQEGKGEYENARDMLCEVSGLVNPSAALMMTQSQVFLKLHDVKMVESTVSKALDLFQRKSYLTFGNKANMMRKLNLLRANAYCKSSSSTKVSKAIDICKEILSADNLAVEEKINCHVCLGYAYLITGQTGEYKQICEIMSAYPENASIQGLEGWGLYQEGDYPAAQARLEKAVSMSDNNGQYLYYLARVYRELGSSNPNFLDKSFNTFLQAAKADPLYSPSFLHLGKYYQEVLKELSKAKRCYQKAYQLDSASELAGAATVDTMVALGEEDAAFTILQSVTSKARPGEAKWAWLRLGLHQLKHDDPTVAISSLQSALRADITDRHCWECLGEAYMKRGSYTAALKAFTRTTELDPSATYCHYQIAYIKQTLGQYTEALTEYLGILEKAPNYVPALKGAGETNVLLAKEAVQQYFQGRAIDHCQEAYVYLTRAAVSRPDLSCIWKLLGDAGMVLDPIPAELVRIPIPSRLLSQGKEGEDMVTVNKRDLVALRARCYGMAVKQQPDCSSLWHDLGVSYYSQARCEETTASSGLYVKSVQCLQKALVLEPDNYRHWNALGLVAMARDVDHPALAQHAFIKSIEVEANNVVAWTNLGTLYFIKDQIELAHQAFKVAQSLEPSYVAAWIGQALIAETVGHEDTMDLFRHTTELAMHLEGATGYAQWVCSTLLDASKMKSELFRYAIEQMAAVPAASDSLAKYTDRVRDNSAAFNLYGLLLERQGLNTSSAKAFHSAVKLLENNGNVEELAGARENYARLLIKSGEAEAAVAQYKLLEYQKSFDLCVGMALAHYKAGSIAKSYNAYEHALKLTEDVEDKSHVYAAMGMLAYSVNDLGGAKSALFQSSQCSPPSAMGLQALLGLGLLQNDLTLTMAAHLEASKLTQQGQLAEKLEYLTACLHHLQSTGEMGVSQDYLSRAIHKTPDNSTLWLHLAAELTRNSAKSNTTASSCAQAAKELQNVLSKDGSMVYSMSMLASGLHSPTDSNRNAFSAAQKALHSHPDQLSSWCGLLSAAQAQFQFIESRAEEKLQGLVLSLASHIMARVESELTHAEGDKTSMQALHLWCVKQYVMALIRAGRNEQAHKFLQSALWLYEGDTGLQALLTFLDQNLASLKGICGQDTSSLSWQLLIGLYMSHGLNKEVENTYNEWIKNASHLPDKLMALTKLGYHFYHQLVIGKDTERCIQLIHEVAKEALKLSPNCPPIKLMQGLVYLREDNNRFSRRSFQQILQAREVSSLPEVNCIARKELLKIYMAKDDKDNIESLLDNAAEDNDKIFLQLYEELLNKK